MKILRVLPAFVTVLVTPAWAVYAPIPEQEQGKEFTGSVNVGLSHDSNIFGAQSATISSSVFTVSPSLKFNSSLTDQTFFSANYALTIDHFENRPGDKTLDSHDLGVRLAHSFSPTTSMDVSDEYTISKNPASLLAGVPLNTDQSYKRNQFDGRLQTSAGEKNSLTAKVRSVAYNYDNAALGTDLDRTENLFGLELGRDLVPELKINGEYRRQTVNYRSAGGNKDKQSNFLIGGFNYAVAKKLTATGRAGYEWRERDGAPDTGAPYAEFSAKADYAERSYLTAGYVHTFEEASNVVQFTDTEVNRFFVNVQHSVSALVVASASFNYEPSTLQGRGAQVDIDERTTRFGLALTYLPTQHLSVAATFDDDHVKSDDVTRGMKRQRYGVNATYSF